MEAERLRIAGSTIGLAHEAIGTGLVARPELADGGCCTRAPPRCGQGEFGFGPRILRRPSGDSSTDRRVQPPLCRTELSAGRFDARVLPEGYTELAWDRPFRHFGLSTTTCATNRVRRERTTT